MVHIYHLYDKKLQVPVYVGATNNVEFRFKNHLRTTLKKYENKDAVCLEVLDTVEQSEAGDVEMFWLNKYIGQGIALLNPTSRKYPAGCATTPSSNSINSAIKSKMRLTKKAIKAVNTKSMRPLLALALRKSEASITRYIYANEDNGLLTTAAALKLIIDETGMQQSDILEEATELAKAV